MTHSLLLALLLAVAPDGTPDAGAAPGPSPAPPPPAARGGDALAGLDPSQQAAVGAWLAKAGLPAGTTVLGAPWPQRQGTYLVAAALPDPVALRLFALDLTGAAVLQLAASPAPAPLGRDDQLARFDLAPYRLNEQEHAFGVRVERQRGYAGGGAELTSLLVFRLNAGRIEEILRTPVSFDALLAGDWNQDGSRQHQSYAGRAVLIVTSRKTDGVFDWIKRANGKSVSLVWSKDRYTMKGGDPLQREDLEIFSPAE